VLTLFATGESYRHATTINTLPDVVLLEIFDFYRKCHDYLLRAVWKWPLLARVCQRWRQVVFASPRRLNLRILCTHGTPVRDLGIWPAFPIVMDYYYYSKSGLMSNDEDDVVTVLEQLDRICDLRLSVTGSQLEKIAMAMQEPFPVLSRLHIFSRDGDGLVLPAEFLGGSAPRLQEITLSGIPHPSLPTLLLSATDLVTLSLRNIPPTGYVSPEAMVACLAMLTRLKALHIEFRSATPRPDPIPQPPVTRSVLPALTEFEFQGASEYLEGLVAGIDGPQLNRIHTVYLNQVVDFEAAQLSDFIDHSIGPRLTLFRHAEVTFVRDFVSFDLYPQTYHPSSDWGLVRTVVSCKGIDWQVSHITQVLSQFSAILSNIVLLQLKAEVEEDSELEGTNAEWLHLLHQFSTVQTLRVSGELAGHVAHALEDITAEMVGEVLPFLNSIFLAGQPASSIKKFVAARQLSNRPVTVVNPEIDHEVLVHDLRTALAPHIAATRAEPLDYDLLTEQLSQAIKPHISNVIDLASDKRETADFLLDRLIPSFQKIFPPACIDVPAVVAQIAAELRRFITQLDPHEMKEQVSGVVAGSLHSHLATYDGVLDALQNKLSQFDNALGPVRDVASRMAELSKSQATLSTQTRDLVAASHNTNDILSTLPELLASATAPLRTMVADLISIGSTSGKALPPSGDLLRFGSTVDSLSTCQQKMQDKAPELLASRQDVSSRVMYLLDSMAAPINAARLEDSFKEVKCMTATNSDRQVQPAKTRVQDVAAQPERAIGPERICSVESELDQLRAKVDSIQATMILRATDAATSQERTVGLTEAQSQPLTRLETSDVTTESQQERIFELEKLNRKLNADNQALVSKASAKCVLFLWRLSSQPRQTAALPGRAG
jgi:hypothetical protein